jgi:ABC-type sugar transport system permease subunit
VRAEARAGLGFAGIVLTPVVLFVVLPMLGALVLSFTDFTLFLDDVKFVGWSNYRDVLDDELFWHALRNTVQYTLESVPPTIVLAFIFALLLNRKLRGIGLLRTMFYLPTVTSFVAVGVVWTAVFDPTKGVTRFFGGQDWLDDPKLALHALAIVTAWKSFGLFMIIYLAGLQGIPQEIYEAAALDGAGPFATVRHITWPLMRPLTFFLVIVGVIGSLQSFDLIVVMTQGGPIDSTTTLVHQVYQNAFVYSRMGYASALAFIVFIIIMMVTAVNVLVFRRDFGGAR